MNSVKSNPELRPDLPEQPSATPATGPDPAKKRSMMMYATAAAAAVVVLGAGAWWLFGRAPAKPPVKERSVTIGFMHITGAKSHAGNGHKQGIDLAQKYLQEEGLTINILSIDTNCDAPSAVSAMNEFVAQHVIAAIGEGCSAATLAAAPIAEANHIPLVSISSTSAKLTTAGDYIFRTIPSDALASGFTANYIYTKRAIHNIAILYGDEPYGSGLNTDVTTAFQKLGGKVLTSQSVKPESTDVKTQLQTIKATNPEAIYMATNSPATAQVALAQMKALGITVPIICSETLKNQTFLDDASTLANSIAIVGVSEGTPSFVEKVRAATNADPLVYSDQAYDAYEALFRALKSGAETSDQVKDALYKVDFDGASGHIKFDSNGDVAANYVIYKVTDGKAKVEN